MKLKIEIAMGSSAFGNADDARSAEAARILQLLTDQIRQHGLPPGYGDYRLRDFNGVPVGKAEVAP